MLPAPQTWDDKGMKFSKSSQLLNAHKSTKEDNWFLSLIFGDINIDTHTTHTHTYTNEKITENEEMGTPTTSNYPIKLRWAISRSQDWLFYTYPLRNEKTDFQQMSIKWTKTRILTFTQLLPFHLSFPKWSASLSDIDSLVYSMTTQDRNRDSHYSKCYRYFTEKRHPSNQRLWRSSNYVKFADFQIKAILLLDGTIQLR